jgi:hypothetical protein
VVPLYLQSLQPFRRSARLDVGHSTGKIDRGIVGLCDVQNAQLDPAIRTCETLARLVNVTTHRLHVSTSGPCRKHGEPVIIFCTGGGTPAIAYIRLQRLLSQHWRAYVKTDLDMTEGNYAYGPASCRGTSNST